MGEDDPDLASALQLRQQILDQWPEDEKKDRVLDAIDGLLLKRREGSFEGPSLD